MKMGVGKVGPVVTEGEHLCMKMRVLRNSSLIITYFYGIMEQKEIRETYSRPISYFKTRIADYVNAIKSFEIYINNIAFHCREINLATIIGINLKIEKALLITHFKYFRFNLS